MTKTLPENTLIVVADGGGAAMFRNVGKGGAVSLTEERKMLPKDLAAEGPSGSRPEDQTPRQTDEATFAKQLAHAVYTMKHAGKFEHLVLIADPQTLGQFRNAMHKTVEESIVFNAVQRPNKSLDRRYS